METGYDDGALDRQIAGLAAALLERLDELAEAMAEWIRKEVTAYVDDTLVPYADLRADCHAQLRSILPRLCGPEPADISYARQSGRRRAELGVPLAKAMDAYRVGGRFIWEALVAEAERTGSLGSEALVRAASRIWLILDDFTDAMAGAYRDAVAERIVGQEHERSALVEALLEGRITENETLWEAAEILRISRRGPFVVVAAEVPEVGRQALPEMEARLRSVGMASAWRLLADLQVGIVVLPEDDRIDQLVTALEKHARHRVGVSPQYPTLEGTREALRFAKFAILGTAPGAGVTLFDSAPLAVTAASTPEVMARIVSSTLSPLDSLPVADRELLLDTLEAWRDGGGSTEQAAKLLFVHPNTVRQRLRRIAELTGCTLTAPRHVAQLCLALEAVRQQQG
ncbi:helix-turn-helix domain-containing protein [Streptomyces sp. SID13031]|uniref:PucR family transcriptional regulator n=1 Tax=Streptomyces sp. SID13031 TaxID=2706046 RepID=UPI0013C6E9B2|nr:helix-turn-helix domain-containing protein [Streptomyces sp. SID13031]NEA30592.1 PucR family transcriptional regulator [Streptomyces sp. SID13031]